MEQDILYLDDQAKALDAQETGPTGPNALNELKNTIDAIFQMENLSPEAIAQEPPSFAEPMTQEASFETALPNEVLSEYHLGNNRSIYLKHLFVDNFHVEETAEPGIMPEKPDYSGQIFYIPNKLAEGPKPPDWAFVDGVNVAGLDDFTPPKK